MAVHVRLIWIFVPFFPVGPLQNNMKLPSSAYFEEREWRRVIFRISFGIERWRYIFNLSKFWDQ